MRWRSHLFSSSRRSRVGVLPSSPVLPDRQLKKILPACHVCPLSNVLSTEDHWRGASGMSKLKENLQVVLVGGLCILLAALMAVSASASILI